MQFSVPQFTDVEDRIVAGLTIKQFGIVFGAGTLVFVIFTLTKSLPGTIAAGLILGLPSLIVAFGRINGRPIYSTFGPLIGYMTGGRLYVFHKQAKTLPQDRITKIEVTAPSITRLGAEAAMTRLKNLNYVLQQQASQEQVLLDHIETARENERNQAQNR